MEKKFQDKFEMLQGWLGGLYLLIGEFVIMIAATQFHFWGCSAIVFTTTSILLGVGIILDSIWFVPTGYVGILTIVGKQVKKSYREGIRFRIPFISDTKLLQINDQAIVLEDSLKKVISRNRMDQFKVICTYTLKEKDAYWIIARLGEDYMEKFLRPWVDAAIDTIVGKLTYAHFQGKKDEIQIWLSKFVRYSLAKQMSQSTAHLASGRTFEITECHLETVINPDGTVEMENLIIDDKGGIEQVIKLDFVESQTILDGVNPFDKVIIEINNYSFEKAYEEAKATVKVAEAGVEAAKRNAEKVEIDTNALAYATKERGAAEAKAYEYKVKALGGDPNVLAKFEIADAIRKHQGTIVLGKDVAPVLNT